MKKLLSIIAIVSACFFCSAQTNDTGTNAPIFGGPITNIFNFIGSGSNFMTAAYGIVSADGEKTGGGLALAYKINDYVAPVLRVDYYDREIWMPSGSLQLQLPLTISSKVRVTPFVFAGVATPLNSETDRPVEGIFGLGAAVGLTSKISLVADVEVWTGFESEQLRFGVLYKF
jgi:hypothetical protein